MLALHGKKVGQDGDTKQRTVRSPRLSCSSMHFDRSVSSLLSSTHDEISIHVPPAMHSWTPHNGCWHATTDPQIRPAWPADTAWIQGSIACQDPLRKTPQLQHRSSSQNHAARLIPGAARELQLQLIPVLCMLGSQSTREHSCCDRSGMISLRIDRCFSPSGRDDSQCCPAAACLLPLS